MDNINSSYMMRMMLTSSSVILTYITLQKFVVLMASLVVAMLCVIVSLSSFIFHTHHTRKLFVGSIGIVTSMSMYSAPLVAVVSTFSYHIYRIMDYRYILLE